LGNTRDDIKVNIFSLDVETTTFQKGDPFASCNSMVLGAIGTDKLYTPFNTSATRGVQRSLDGAQLVVLFNAKFDLHWCRRVGLHFGVRLPIWDCQLAEFILSNQQWKYPSLDEACERRGLPRKLDIVKTEYWEKGIDTPNIPHEILDEYLHQDISCTYQLYLAQLAAFKTPEHAGKYKLFRLCCYDLMVLQEMEYNGFLFACEEAKAESVRLEKESTKFDAIIYREFPDIPINLGSPNHISCMLYGGEITATSKVPIGVFKTGARAGQPKFQNVDLIYKLERLVEPLKGSALAKEGYYGTSEDILKSLKGSGKVNRIISALLDRRGIEKLRGTYYDGIPKLIEEHSWPNSTVHGQFNQCVAVTGRLSSTKPNQQNLPGGCKKFCRSRYEM